VSPPRRTRLAARALCLGAAVLASALPALAAAKTCRLESRARDLDVEAVARLAERGELALIENAADGSARQVVLFAVLPAAPERVFDLLMDVESYPKFVRTVVATKITRREGPQLAYDWALDLPFFDLKGARVQRGLRPGLIEVRGERGDLVGSKERWELYPLAGGERTLAAFYRALDVDTGGLVLRAAVKLEPSMEQAANLSTGFVHLTAVKRHLAGLPALAPRGRTGPVPRFTSLPLGTRAMELSRLERLLRHGQLAVIESHEDGTLKQAALFATVDAPKDKLAAIIGAPGKYPEFIPNFAEQEVTPEADGRLRMRWELEVPLTNLEGSSLMSFEPDGAVDVVAVEGDIKRGRWRWELHPLDAARTLPVHYAYSDVRESSWVTRKLVEKEPLFEHGIVIASGTVALTAMKARAEGRR
jgi:ribosome-associated toxin RatA of RatAB toxin-antitoxin module